MPIILFFVSIAVFLIGLVYRKKKLYVTAILLGLGSCIWFTITFQQNYARGICLASVAQKWEENEDDMIFELTNNRKEQEANCIS